MRTVYFISAGLAETHYPKHDVRFGAGAVMGAEEALRDERVTATSRSLQFGHFMTMSARDFCKLVEDYPRIGENLERLVQARSKGELPDAQLLPQAGKDAPESPPSYDAIDLATAPVTRAIPINHDSEATDA
ncbi:hypothetical protein RAA17_09940 [Komagataeibacter rhaeticus]|nr:hypothetical protein [Komagataeibacter rhaeticus]